MHLHIGKPTACTHSPRWLQVRRLLEEHSSAVLKDLLAEVGLEWQPGEPDARDDALQRLASKIYLEQR